MGTRWALGSIGVVAVTYGAFLVLGRGWEDIPALVVWLAVGVVLHDFVLVPIVLALCWAGRRFLPRPWRASALVALVITGSLSLAAVPVLGRFGARPDNPTLLDRPYLTTWLVLLVLTLAIVIAHGFLRRRAAAG